MTYLTVGSQLFSFCETEVEEKIGLMHLLLWLFPHQEGNLILNSLFDILDIVLNLDTGSLPV